MRYVSAIILIALLLIPVSVFGDATKDKEAILNELGAYADKDPSVLSGAVSALGDAYMRENKVDEAIALYEKALNMFSFDENLLNRIGNLYNQKAQYDKAVGIYKKLTEIRPDNAWYFQMLSNSYSMSGQKDKADDIWDKLIKDKPDNSDVMAQAANFYSNADEIEKAISLGEKSVKLAPDNTGYLQNLATFYARAEKFDKAEEALNKIRKAAKDQWLKEWADREIVNIYQRQDRLDEMKENLEAEAEAKRGDITFLKKLGEVYTRKGENEGALRVYETAVKISPDDRDVNTRLVAIYETMGKTDKAIEQTKKTIQIAPNEPYLLENLANLYNKAGNKEDSRKTWQSLISKVTNDPALYSRHAEALYGWNNLSEAIAYLDKAQAMDSGNLAYTLRKATMLMDAGKIEEAKVALGKVSIEAKEEWMKDEAKRRLDDIVEKIIVPAPVREEIKQQAMPEPVVVKMKSGQKEEEAEKPAEPEKKKKRSWFGR